jgi:flagellar M-ring protein FliF
VLLITGVLLIFFVLRPLLKTATGGGVPALAAVEGAPVTQLQTTVIGPDGQPQLVQLPPPSEMDQKIDIARIEGQVKASSVKKVADFVHAHPDEAAGILRNWVAEG